MERYNLAHVYLVFTNSGYWGKGDTIEQAAYNAKYAGARSTDLVVIDIVASHQMTQGEISKETSGSGGATSYHTKSDNIRLITPRLHKVKLGALIPKGYKPVKASDNKETPENLDHTQAQVTTEEANPYQMD